MAAKPLSKSLLLGLLPVFLLFGCLDTAYRSLDRLARGAAMEFTSVAIEEMTGAFAGWLLFPGIVWCVRHFRWPQIWGHLGAGPLYSVIHTTLNYAFRLAGFAVFGLGIYDYGVLPVRYLMELPNDLLQYAIMSTVVFLFDRYTEAKERETALVKAQLESLRLQLQPHFLFNTLNAVSAVMYEDVRRADAMLCKLSQLLRWTIEAPRGHKVTVSEEIEYLKLYLDIMQQRFVSLLEIELDVDPKTRMAAVPQLLLQPVVENACRYGADPLTGKVKVRISVERRGDGLVLGVRDWGPGLAEDSKIGTGLGNTRRRLEKLYGQQHRLSLRNAAGGGLEVRIELPLEMEMSSWDHAAESVSS